LITIEKLILSGMSKNIFSKQIYVVGWKNFFLMLPYKAESAGKKPMKLIGGNVTELFLR